MAEPQAGEEEAPKKKSKLPLLIGLVLMLGLGGGGFYAVYSGMILGTGKSEDHAKEEPVKVEALPDIAYVPVDPLVVTLNGEAKADTIASSETRKDAATCKIDLRQMKQLRRKASGI